MEQKTPRTPEGVRPARWWTILLALGSACLGVGPAHATDNAGHRPDARVGQPTSIDWVFALSNQSPASAPADWLPNYDSSAQSYELYVPKNLRKGVTPGLILFISPGERGTGLSSWREVCDAEGLIFASPHRAGNSTETRQRIRIILDVLDDVRRQHGVDPDRTYIGGFSGGGRTACATGFSLPEYFGGVIPVCASGDLRSESWLRERVRERVCVAYLTGDTDFNRGEVERFRGPMLANVGVRSKVWVAQRTGHAIPPASYCREAIAWLDKALPQRRKLAQEHPASRIAAGAAPSREEQAQALLDEAGRRLRTPASIYTGLMLAKGVLERWPDVQPADEAKAILLKAGQGGDRAWMQEDIAERRRFLLARARALTDYVTGPLPAQYAPQHADMIKSATKLWNLVLEDGQDPATVEEAHRRLAGLAKTRADR